MSGSSPSSGKLTMAQGSQGRFTQVYLTANNHYGIVLYGVVLGFVLYPGFELMAGISAVGALVPTSASLVAALVAIVVGRRVLALKPDGRA
jgi:hypothetical protein